MANVSDMSRDQANNYLRTLGEEAHPRWTALEIKFRIGELTETELDRQKGIGALLRKLQSDPKSDTKGLSGIFCVLHFAVEGHRALVVPGWLSLGK